MHALRSLLKNAPGFSAVCVATLALGIGASTVIFSVVHALLIAPLNYAHADRLTQVLSVHGEQGNSVLAPATFGDLSRDTRAFEALAAFRWDYVNLSKVAAPTQIIGAQTTPDYFNVFGVAPLLGRPWDAEETRSTGPRIVVLGHSLWQSQFGGRTDLVGQDIFLDNVPHTVIAVMPASFKDPLNNAQLWRPLPMDKEEPTVRASRFWNTFARLQPGVTSAVANAELATLSARYAAAHPESHSGWSLRSQPLLDAVVGSTRSGLTALQGAVACLVLITCANVAGLTLVRGTARRKEFAIRAALGASRRQLAGMLLTESVLLSLAGGALGVLLATWGLDALIASTPAGWLPRSDEISINAPVLLATLGLTLLTAVVCGLAPGLTAAGTDAGDSLKDAARGSAGPAATRFRATLVIAEIAIALVLLIGAGLLARSFLTILSKPSGLTTENLLPMGLSLPASRYATPAARGAFYDRVLAEASSLPGVVSVGFTQTTPFRWGIPFTFKPEGAPGFSDQNLPSAIYDSVSSDYFKTTGIPLLAGRVFTEADATGTPPVVVISETAARRYFGRESAVGRRLSVPGSPQNTVFEIVGVVGDVRRNGLDSNPPLQVYRSLRQRPTEFATLMIRTSMPAESVSRSVQQAIWRIDPDLPVSGTVTMNQVVSERLAQPRLYLALFTLFATLALLLAALGVYGLVAYSVAQRTREFGIRVALGADVRRVVNLVLGQGARLALIGVVVGLAAAWGLVRYLESLLFEVRATDPLVFAGVAALLSAATLLATWVPARRAARVNPVEALRSE